MQSILFRVLALVAGALIYTHAPAQLYPAKQIRIIVGFVPGGGSDFIVSAGTAVYFQTSASSETIRILGRYGIDVLEHQSRPINSILLQKADLILVMTRSHRQQVLERVPSVESRVYQLREFLQERPGDDGDLDIFDPMGKSFEAYEECAAMIKAAVLKLVNLL